MLASLLCSTARQRRHVRLVNPAGADVELGISTRVIHFMGKMPRLNHTLSILAILLELAAVILHFVATEAVSDVVESKRYTGRLDVLHVPMLREYALALGILGIFFAAQFCFIVLTHEGETIRFVTSVHGVVALLTSVSMAALIFVGQVVQPAVGGSGGRVQAADAALVVTVFAPTFLRAWWAQEFLRRYIAHYSTVHPAVKEIVSEFALVLAILVSGIGFYQLAQLSGTQTFISFMDCLYFSISTVTTVGFGDIDPSVPVHFREGEIVVMILVFFAMLALPSLLAKFAQMMSYLRSQNYYSRSALHIIIYGDPSPMEMELMLREFMSGSRKFHSLNIVFVSPSEFPPKIIEMSQNPAMQGRLTLCVSDPLERDQMTRFATRKADALFLVSPRSATAERGDLQTILRSVAFYRHDPHLPQYIMLKRSTHAVAVRRWAFAMIERERVKYRLLGLAIRHPGFVPFFFNLITATDLHEFSLDEQESRWWLQYLQGTSNSVYLMPVPQELVGRPFETACLIIFLRTGMIAVAHVAKDSRKLHLCPMRARLRERDRLMLIAVSNRVVAQCAADFEGSKTSERAARKSGSRSGVVGRLFAAADVSDGGVGGSYLHIAASPGARSKMSIRPRRHRANVHPLKGHLVLIDMASALKQPILNPEEKIAASRQQAEDMLSLLKPFAGGERSGDGASPTSFVYLSPIDLSEDFHCRWPRHARPLFHIAGSGVDEKCLARCNVVDAKGVIIFTSLEGLTEASDAHVMIVHDAVHRQLVAAGRDRDVPVVTELENVASMRLCEPRLAQSQSDSAHGENAKNFALTPAFILGRTVSSAMLDTMLYQTYFNELLPQFINQLLFKDNDDGEVVRSQPVTDFFPEAHRPSVSTFCFGDLFRLAVAHECVPLGLHRVIATSERGENLIGHRYMCTSPHPALKLRETDEVYFIVAPDAAGDRQKVGTRKY